MMAKQIAGSWLSSIRASDDDGVLRRLGFDGCVRLPMTVDAALLANEIDRLPADAWGKAQRDPVVQAAVESFFAIGYPRGPLPVSADDRPVLEQLPHLRRLLRDSITATPTRAIVARLRGHGLIPIHTDTPRFFRRTIRLSIQIAAENTQRLYCNGRWYDMAPGEIWAIDNLKPHAVHNNGERPRTNVLVDYMPSPTLADLLRAGEVGLGNRDEEAQAAIEAMSARHYRQRRWRAARYELFKLLWRRTW